MIKKWAVLYSLKVGSIDDLVKYFGQFENLETQDEWPFEKFYDQINRAFRGKSRSPSSEGFKQLS